MADEKLLVWQLPRAWGLPNPSPFCMKLETWLRLAAIPYEARTLTGPPRSRTGKAPYVERADGTISSDTSHIVETLTRERNVELDAHLGPRERALFLLLQRTFEDHFYWFLIHDRWLSDAGWETTRRGYFGDLPLVVRWLVPPLLRRTVRRDARGQGLSRLPISELRSRARGDCEALAEILGEQRYFLGRKSTADAIALAFLANVYLAPIDGLLLEAARPHENLRRYTVDLFAEIFPEYPLPVTG